MSTLGDAVAGIALAFAVLELTGDARSISAIVLAARKVANTAMVLFGGVIADRAAAQPRARRRVARPGRGAGGDRGRRSSRATRRSGSWSRLQLVYGAADGFVIPAQTGLVPQTVSAARLQQANALNGLVRNLIFILGPAVGGVIVVAGSPGIALAVDAVSFVARRAAARADPHPAARGAGGPAANFFHELREGWREFTSRTWLWSTVVVFGLGNIFFMFWPVLGPLVANEHLGGAEPWATILAVERDRGRRRRRSSPCGYRPSRPVVACVLWPMLCALQLVALALHAPTWADRAARRSSPASGSPST